MGSACAAEYALTRSATRRGPHCAGTLDSPAKRPPCCAARHQRCSARQRPCEAAPTTRHGLTCSRTRAGDNIPKPNKASAQTMADALYSLLLRVSAGATVVTAQQSTHR